MDTTQQPSGAGIQEGYDAPCSEVMWVDVLREEENVGDNNGDWYRKIPLIPIGTAAPAPAPAPLSAPEETDVLAKAMSSSLTTVLIDDQWTEPVEGELVGYVDTRKDYRVQFELLIVGYPYTDDALGGGGNEVAMSTWRSIVSFGYDQGFYCPQGQEFCRRPAMMWLPSERTIRVYEGSTDDETEVKRVVG